MALPQWTLKVEKLGRIENAEVTLSPLTIFSGKNNTGKSYLATLIWGLLSIATNDLPLKSIKNKDSKKRSYKESLDKVHAICHKLYNEKINTLTDLEWKEALGYVNQVLETGCSDFVSHIIGHDNIDCSGVKISGDTFCGTFNTNLFKNQIDQINQSIVSRFFERNSFFEFHDGRSEIQLIQPHTEESQKAYFEGVILKILLGGGRREGVIYLPAARTGLVLAYRPLITGMFDEFRSPSLNFLGKLELPAPITSFLANYSRAGARSHRPFRPAGKAHEKKSPFAEVADFLEGEVLRGKIQSPQKDQDDVTYLPLGTEISLPMHAASSLVTELAPFILTLREQITAGSTLIFEEPEAHLHLEAQSLIARALIRLVNHGVQVIITTHSDALLQTINIMMGIHQNPNKENLLRKYKLDQKDIIDPEKVSAYIFRDLEGSATKVEMIHKTAYGFKEPIMNAEIERLSEMYFDVIEQE